LLSEPQNATCVQSPKSLFRVWGERIEIEDLIIVDLELLQSYGNVEKLGEIWVARAMLTTSAWTNDAPLDLDADVSFLYSVTLYITVG